MKNILRRVKRDINQLAEESWQLRELKNRVTINKERIHLMRVNGVRRQLRVLNIISNILREHPYGRCEKHWHQRANWVEIYDTMVQLGLREEMENNVNRLAADGYFYLVEVIESNRDLIAT
jgi:hypothetical protein